VRRRSAEVRARAGALRNQAKATRQKAQTLREQSCTRSGAARPTRETARSPEEPRGSDVTLG